MIYTLEWIKNEAKGIASAWNGLDDRFEYDESTYEANDAEIAEQLLGKLKEVEELMSKLSM